MSASHDERNAAIYWARCGGDGWATIARRHGITSTRVQQLYAGYRARRTAERQRRDAARLTTVEDALPRVVVYAVVRLERFEATRREYDRMLTHWPARYDYLNTNTERREAKESRL